MEDKEAIALLTELLTKYPLSGEEKEAVREAIGILAWTKLMEGRKETLKRAWERRAADNGK